MSWGFGCLGRVLVWRPVAHRSNRVLVARVVKGSCWVWLIRMLGRRFAGFRVIWFSVLPGWLG